MTAIAFSFSCRLLFPFVEWRMSTCINCARRHCRWQIFIFDGELNAQLDRLRPLRQFDRRQRPSVPWFDKECGSQPNVQLFAYPRAFCASSRRAVIATTFGDADAVDAVAEADAAKTAW